MQMQKKIDGVVSFYKDFDYLIPLCSVKIKLPVNVTLAESSKYFKGSRTCANFRNVFIVHLFELCDFFHCIAFFGPEVILFTELIQAYHNAIESAILELVKSNTETGRIFRSRPYRSVSELIACKGHHVEVAVDDLQKFGKLLSEKLTFQITLIQPSYENQICWIFAARCLGQSAAIENYLTRIVNVFNFSTAIETVLHLAYDFSLPQNIVFWRRCTVLNKLQSNPSHEYFPLALNGIANMYFNYSLVDSTIPVFVTTLKVYSEVNKHLHSNYPAPFEKSEIAYELWEICTSTMLNRTEANQKKTVRKLTSYKQRLELIDSLYVDVNGSSARLELLISIVNPASLASAVHYGDYFCHTFDLLNEDCFVVLHPEDVSAQLTKFLKPSCSTIRTHLSKFLASLENEDDMSMLEFCPGCF